jgi:hypothetical protein
MALTDCRLLDPAPPALLEALSPPPPPPQPTSRAALNAIIKPALDRAPSNFDRNMNALALRTLTQGCRHLKRQLEACKAIDNL